jgi:hypothetical protein
MLKKLKGLVFEEKATEAAPTPAAAPSSAPSQFLMVGENSDLYQNLKDATDFEKTSSGVILAKYLLPLAAIPGDPNTKLKQAATLASSLDGLTSEKILTSFTEMKANISKEESTFNSEIAGFIAENIDAPTKRAVELRTEIEKLQAEQNTLIAQATEANTKATTLKTQFSMALQRRTAEIDQEIVRVSTILKG